MDLRSFEGTYEGFYAPSFKVLANGQDLVKSLFLTVTSAEVDLKEKTAGRFTFTVANAFDWKSRSFVAKRAEVQTNLMELFAFGSPIQIFVGYAPNQLVALLTGIVTEMNTSFSEGSSPELTISGYDKLYPLTIGKKSRNWENRQDSDAVRDLVSNTGLTLDVTPTNPLRPRIDQTQESDMSLLEKLAERNGATFYALGTRFRFGARNNRASDAVKLPWGKGLLTFSPNVNLARQVQTVEVRSWSAEQGDFITGRATSGDESGRDSGRQSGAQRVASALNNQPSMRVHAAVHTQAEANARAQAVLEERAQEFLEADAECIGLPEIVPDVNVAISDLGDPFSKTYYVSEAKHKVDGNGYRTSFHVRETTV